MQIESVKFEHFRSFGAFTSKINLDHQITFFVGKNHTGKSNIFKILNELKQHDIPSNPAYLLDPANWFNYEAGVDRPLKIILECSLNDEEHLDFCKTWFFQPMAVALNNFMQKSSSTLKFPRFDMQENKENWMKSLKKIFPTLKCVLRLEFIRISENVQNLNFSIEFNNFIVVKTADGRSFIQNIRSPIPSKYREVITWEDHWKQILETQLNQILASSNPINTYILKVIQTGKKYMYETKQIYRFYTYLFDHVSLFHSSRNIHPSLYEPSSTLSLQKLNHLLAVKLTKKLHHAPIYSKEWYKLCDLHAQFEAIYESLDITFGIEQMDEDPYINYFNRSENRIIYNFDSIGLGITAKLYLLYQLIVEENQIIALDTPEYQLHPHSQRNLYNLIREYVVKNHHQVIIITHSPYFIHPDDIFQLRIFNLTNGITSISQIERPKTERDYYKLKRNFTIRNRDAIFADGLIFVEGPSEEWAFPYLFKIYGLDLDLYNLSLINLHGKGSFEVFWRFAHQIQKKFWFFFDNDILGVAAGEEITQDLFKRSIIYRNRRLFPANIRQLCHGIVYSEYGTPIEFHEDLELLRSLLEEIHVFILKDDFEGIFESFLTGKILFSGGKVEKSIQLIEFLQNHEEEQLVPEVLYRYIKLIQEELQIQE